MVARAVHFALNDEQSSRLMDTPGKGNDELLAFLEEVEEGPNGEGWDDEWTQETDKSWDAIHRCLTGGKLEWGDTPFHKCVLGSDNLFEGDDYLMSYLDPEEVKEVAEAIKDIGRDEVPGGTTPLTPRVTGSCRTATSSTLGVGSRTCGTSFRRPHQPTAICCLSWINERVTLNQEMRLTGTSKPAPHR